jgi:hypothetical protein
MAVTRCGFKPRDYVVVNRGKRGQLVFTRSRTAQDVK